MNKASFWQVLAYFALDGLARTARSFPGFCIFPTAVNAVVDVMQQGFAAIKKSEADEVVIHKRAPGAEKDVEEEGREGAADAAFFEGDLCTQRGVAVHVLYVQVHVGIGVVNHVALELGDGSVRREHLGDFM